MFSVSTGSISGRECKIGLQRDQHREDRTGDTEEPNGGINRDFTETLHQFGKLITWVLRFYRSLPFENKYYEMKEVLEQIVRSSILMKRICEEYSMVYGFVETNMET